MNYSVEGTNVISAEEFIDRVKAEAKVESLDYSTMSEWTKTLEPSFGWKNYSDEKGKAEAITKLYPSKGSFYGVGGMYEGMVLVKGLKSKFLTHAYSFCDTRKPLLEEPLDELLSHELPKKEFEDLVKIDISFELYSDEQEFESPETLEEVRSLELLRYLMAYSALKEMKNLPKNAVPKVEGFLKTAPDSYHLDEYVTKLKSTMMLRSRDEKRDNSVEIVYWNSEEGKFVEIAEECKTLFDYMIMMRNKVMDVVFYVDSCSVRRSGEVTVFPKIAIHEIILHDYVQRDKETVGLRLDI